MARKKPEALRYPQKSHPRLSAEEAKARARERQRQKRARRRAEQASKQHDDRVATHLEGIGGQFLMLIQCMILHTDLLITCRIWIRDPSL